MRKTMLAAIMAASALVPAAAFAQNDHGHGGWRQHEGNGGGQGQGGHQQAQPQQQAQPRFERPQGQPEARHFDRGQVQTQAQPQQQPRGNWQGNRAGGWAGRQQPQQQQPVVTPQVQQQQDWRNRGGRNDQHADGRQQGGRGDWHGNDGQRGDWRGNDGRQRVDNRGGGNWNRNWRNDNRYNWSNARRYNRDNFHLPRYYAPYGWDYGYRRFSLGFRLSSILFAESYWIDDASYYDLPPAYGPYRWVRYYNDALLVDIYTGEVVDTVYDIFW
jgi:Nickel/cobalt transporter regulator